MILFLAAAMQAAAAPVPPPAPERRVVIVRKVGRDGKVTEQRLEGDAATAEAAAAGRRCDPARTFSSEVDRTVDGKRQVSRIKLCARRGESVAQWQQALRTARERVKSDAGLPADTRARILADLDTAIARAGQR